MVLSRMESCDNPGEDSVDVRRRGRGGGSMTTEEDMGSAASALVLELSKSRCGSVEPVAGGGVDRVAPKSEPGSEPGGSGSAIFL